jgi:hypothetical protein
VVGESPSEDPDAHRGHGNAQVGEGLSCSRLDVRQYRPQAICGPTGRGLKSGRRTPSNDSYLASYPDRPAAQPGQELSVVSGSFSRFEQVKPANRAQGIEFVVRLHYDITMKDAVIPQVRVETELRASLDAILRPGETLTDFVEVAVRNAVEYRRVQTAFTARCEASLAEYERTGVSIPAAQVIAKLESKLAMRRKQLGG